MTTHILDGKKLAEKIRAEIRSELSNNGKKSRAPALAVILVGDDPASTVYVRNKQRASEEAGIHSILHKLSAAISQKELIALIEQLNHDSQIDGILLQLPLPKHLNPDDLLEVIHPDKDVDGFHPFNLGRLAQRRPALRPCTPYGIMTLLDSIQQPYKKKHAVIIGASNIVGRPMALELLTAGATVTICHRFTEDLSQHVKQADILIAAIGKPDVIKSEWIKENATVIDVGINRLEDESIVGDIEFESAC
ncbi:bifunctional methylenetetrahydrofolate dehydrogenase/methenyltetrahydrofolate cyclohydrolase, partial [Gammaproteobacteria bacterium SCGC AG-212-F23]